VSLRPYQSRAISDLRAQYAASHRAPCLVLPTGAGKTVVASEVIRLTVERGGRVLFLVHRAELLGQSVDKLERAGISDLRIIQAGSDLGSRHSRVSVASIPTLTRWVDAARPLPVATLVVIDECHHVAAKTWRTLADTTPRRSCLA
jgi:superfamily II DNA or RNA helicase